MTEPRRMIRISPRRHDVGAALMLKFRPKDGSTIRNRRLRGTDILQACVLPLVCFALAFAVKEQQGAHWFSPVPTLASPTEQPLAKTPALANRIAPASPLDREPPVARVRLTHIETLSDGRSISVPVSLKREIRVAEDDAPVAAPVEAKAPEPTLRAAALNLGEQPMRAIRR